MLYRSNIFALIGGGRNPKKSLNKLMLWEDNQKKIIGEMSFKSDVRSVRMREKKFHFHFFFQNPNFFKKQNKICRCSFARNFRL